MAITGAGPDVDYGDTRIGFWDINPLTKMQTAKAIIDVGLLFTPLAIFSGIRRAMYVRRGIQATRAAPAGSRMLAVERYMVERPIRSTLFLAGGTAGVTVSPISPIYPQILLAQGTADHLIAYYMDREGRIKSFIPTDVFIREYLESLGEDSTSTGTPPSFRSFYDLDGLGAMKTIMGATPITSFEIAPYTGNARKIKNKPRMVRRRGQRCPPGYRYDAKKKMCIQTFKR